MAYKEYPQVFCKVCGAEISIYRNGGPKDHAEAKTCRLIDQKHLDLKETCCYKWKIINLKSRTNLKPQGRARGVVSSACQAKKAPIRKHRYVDNPAISELAPIVPVEKMPVTRYVPHCLAKMPVDISTPDVIVKFITCGESRAICPTYTPPRADDIIPFPKARGEYADDYVRKENKEHFKAVRL